MVPKLSTATAAENEGFRPGWRPLAHCVCRAGGCLCLKRVNGGHSNIHLVKYCTQYELLVDNANLVTTHEIAYVSPLLLSSGSFLPRSRLHCIRYKGFCAAHEHKPSETCAHMMNTCASYHKLAVHSIHSLGAAPSAHRPQTSGSRCRVGVPTLHPH